MDTNILPSNSMASAGYPKKKLSKCTDSRPSVGAVWEKAGQTTCMRCNGEKI